MFSAWLTPPIVPHLSVYVFNITNPEEVGRHYLLHHHHHHDNHKKTEEAKNYQQYLNASKMMQITIFLSYTGPLDYLSTQKSSQGIFQNFPLSLSDFRPQNLFAANLFSSALAITTARRWVEGGKKLLNSFFCSSAPSASIGTAKDFLRNVFWGNVLLKKVKI